MCVCVYREKEKAAQREMQVGTVLAAKDRKLEELKKVCMCVRMYQPSCTHALTHVCVYVACLYVCMCVCVGRCYQ